MKLEIARQVKEQAQEDRRITAQIIRRGQGWQMKLILRARHIERRELTIHTEKQWQSVKACWEGL